MIDPVPNIVWGLASEARSVSVLDPSGEDGGVIDAEGVSAAEEGIDGMVAILVFGVPVMRGIELQRLRYSRKL